MCTVITERMREHPRIAKRDLKVYKAGYNNWDGIFHCSYRSYAYEKDVEHNTDFGFSYDSSVYDKVEKNYSDSIPEGNRVYVTNGFHSFLTKCKDRVSSRESFALFIIPKGSKYYCNKVGNVVSDTIIFKNFL